MAHVWAILLLLSWRPSSQTWAVDSSPGVGGRIFCLQSHPLGTPQRCSAVHCSSRPARQDPPSLQETLGTLSRLSVGLYVRACVPRGAQAGARGALSGGSAGRRFCAFVGISLRLRGGEQDARRESAEESQTRDFDATFFVDPDRGDDEHGDGTNALPLASIFAALARAASSHSTAAVLLAPGKVFSGRRYYGVLLW